MTLLGIFQHSAWEIRVVWSAPGCYDCTRLPCPPCK